MNLESKLKQIEGIINEIRQGSGQEPPELPDLTGAYAVVWNYKKKNGSRLTRAGLSKDFADPRPATELKEEGFSPFDEVMPWKGMETVSFSCKAGYDVMVYIPEFWFYAMKDKANKRWIWAISPEEREGFKKHPGSGRYVGRYHTSEDDDGRLFSRERKKPLTMATWNYFKDHYKNKKDGFGMMDIATWSAIQLLYLVEFADFDSRKCLGAGYKSSNWETGFSGDTDVAKYHTVKRSGRSNQYRWIEDPFSNVFDWIDGFAGCMDECWINEENLGFGLPNDGWIKNFGYSKEAPWAFIPSRSSDGETAIPDYTWSSFSALRPASVGGSYYGNAHYGLFYFGASNGASYTYAYLGSRLQKT